MSEGKGKRPVQNLTNNCYNDENICIKCLHKADEPLKEQPCTNCGADLRELYSSHRWIMTVEKIDEINEINKTEFSKDARESD